MQRLIEAFIAFAWASGLSGLIGSQIYLCPWATFKSTELAVEGLTLSVASIWGLIILGNLGKTNEEIKK